MPHLVLNLTDFNSLPAHEIIHTSLREPGATPSTTPMWSPEAVSSSGAVCSINNLLSEFICLRSGVLFSHFLLFRVGSLPHQPGGYEAVGTKVICCPFPVFAFFWCQWPDFPLGIPSLRSDLVVQVGLALTVTQPWLISIFHPRCHSDWFRYRYMTRLDPLRVNSRT